jgi:adenosylhomocysteine nucleosidase
MSFITSAEWRKRVAAGLERFKPVGDGRLLTSKSAISAAAAKAAMFRDTGARAVDMESAAVAHLAALHALPFIAARVIVDTADDSLPESVMRASGSGELQLWRLVGALALAPTEIAGVLRLARRFRLAQRSLRAIARADSLREAMA